MSTIRPSVLILGSQYDLTCDYVVARLRQLGCCYMRINSDELSHVATALNPANGTLTVHRTDHVYSVDACEVKSILYRRPVFLRDYTSSVEQSFEHFQRHQWAAFLRNLMIFDSSVWVNHPTATYFAEHKAVQLRVAQKIGFSIPATLVTNEKSFIPPGLYRNEEVVVKGLDTVMLRQGSKETFGFTQILHRQQIIKEPIRAAPAIFQQVVMPKTDIRVTVIGKDVFSVAIVSNEGLIRGDWRIDKTNVRFVPHELPADILSKCIALLKDLGLVYGAIDLGLTEGEYFFFEVNPTGEWAWLVDAAGLPIDASIAEYLANPGTNHD